MKKAQRRFIVFTSLIAVLTLTSALLLALAPAPLSPDASSSLFAIDAPQSMDVIFQTRQPCQTDRWQYIYIRHSRTAAGSALSISQPKGGLGDHFVIGNGDGAVDGEIQIGQRRDTQTSATPPAGASSIDPACISICLIGDFDQTRPTPTQLHRLVQLVNTLQARFRVPAQNIMLVNQPKSPSGIGKYFPQSALREQLAALSRIRPHALVRRTSSLKNSVILSVPRKLGRFT